MGDGQTMCKLSWSFFPYVIQGFVGNIIDLGSGKMSLYSGNGQQHGDIEHDQDPSAVWAHIKSLLNAGEWQSREKNTGGVYANATAEGNAIQFLKEKHILIYATGVWRHQNGNRTRFGDLLSAIQRDAGIEDPSDFEYNDYRVEVRLLPGREEAQWGGSCVAYYL